MSPSPTTRPLCVITGAQGYLGNRLVRFFLRDGWRVLGLSRNPPTGGPVPGLSWASFALGQDRLPPEAAHADALIHCAYDFSPRRWPEIVARNVTGTTRLFTAARQNGIRQIVLISSMSAYGGCRSYYGRAKLAAEDTAREQGALLVRPGLIYGPQPGGMFGRLVNQVRRSQLTPLFGRGHQLLHLVHEDDLALFLASHLRSSAPVPLQPVIAAQPQGWRFRDLLTEIAREHNRSLIFLPVPWRPVWLFLKLLEAVGMPLHFRSDSLLSLMHQDPNPDFSAARQAGYLSREFRPPSESEK